MSHINSRTGARKLQLKESITKQNEVQFEIESEFLKLTFFKSIKKIFTPLRTRDKTVKCFLFNQKKQFCLLLSNMYITV